MQYLLDKLNKQRTDADGADIYTDDDGGLTLRVDTKAGRTEIRSATGEVTLIRNQHGRWVPANDNWPLLARVLGSPGLVAATLGF